MVNGKHRYGETLKVKTETNFGILIEQLTESERAQVVELINSLKGDVATE